MRYLLPLAILALASTTPACGDDADAGDADTVDAVALDTGGPADTTSGDDTGSSADTSVAEDTGTAADTASGADTSVVTDTSSAEDTSNAEDSVSGDTSSPEDTSTEVDTVTVSDTVTPVDTTGPADTSGGGVEPVGDNVLVDGSFESWSGGLPDGWYGEASNLSTDAVVEDDSAAHDGVRACQLVNAGDSHKRFTSSPISAQAGHYTCLYWVRGAGEIRNARYDGDYSSYSGYTAIDDDAWTQIAYTFNVAEDVTDALELIFSVRNTDASRGHLHIDDVHCARAAEACDAVTCEDWQQCDDATALCEPAPGFCGDADDCLAWEECGDDHLCALAPGRCYGTADCDGATPVCDLPTHTCVAGDPCEGVECETWQICNPADATCDLADGACLSHADCLQDLPVCDVSAHACVAVDDPANIVPNGGFEAWDDYTLGGSASFYLPDAWYGVCDGCSPYFPETEADPNSVLPYDAAPHTGDLACQLVDTGTPAERFATEPFAATSTVTYSCAYWVRGHGTWRHRSYCGAWGPNTEFEAIDSDAWQQVTFEMTPQISECVLIFYASNTDADRDHLQIDDVVCARKSAP